MARAALRQRLAAGSSSGSSGQAASMKREARGLLDRTHNQALKATVRVCQEKAYIGVAHVNHCAVRRSSR